MQHLLLFSKMYPEPRSRFSIGGPGIPFPSSSSFMYFRLAPACRKEFLGTPVLITECQSFFARSSASFWAARVRWFAPPPPYLPSISRPDNGFDSFTFSLVWLILTGTVRARARPHPLESGQDDPSLLTCIPSVLLSTPPVSWRGSQDSPTRSRPALFTS